MINYTTLFNETKNLSVLFVEDYEPLRLEMAEILEELFKRVSVASNGQEALDAYEEASKEAKGFDLIISDIQMPVMDGVALSKNIRKLNEKQPIMILSAHSDSDYLVQLINIGISKFLSKPINHDDFFTILYDESKKINGQSTEVPEESMLVDIGEGYTWNRDKLVLKHDDNTVALTKHELLLLKFFIHKKNYICTSFEIIEHFYTNNIDLSEKNVRNLIFKVRKKVPSKCITSVYGLGYKFTTL